MTILSNQVKLYFVIIESIFVLLVGLPLLIYYYKGFNKLRHSGSVMIQKRYPHILKVQWICIMLWFINLPFLSISWAEFLFDSNSLNYIMIITARIAQSIYPLSTLGAFLTIAQRFWHIYFDLKYSSSQKNSEWKYHLDPNLVEHNFWLTHKKDYGSTKWTKQFTIIFFIIFAIMVITSYQILISYNLMILGHAFSAIIHGLICLFAFITWSKVPAYSDYFFIRDEMKIVFTGIVCGVLFAFIAVLAGLIFFLHLFTILMMIESIFATLILFSVVFVSFWFIPKKIRLEEDKIKILTMRSLSHPSSPSSPSSKSGYNDESMGSIGRIARAGSEHRTRFGNIVKRLSIQSHSNITLSTLHTTLSNERTFKAFMQHLAKEFSMECLLCFVEIVQYKFAMKERFDIIDPSAIKSESNFTAQCPLSHVVPMSIINKQGFEHNLTKYTFKEDPTKLMNEAKNVCLQIYWKYIVVGSELEVNISFNRRSRITNLMSDKTFFMQFNIKPNELFCIYDHVAMTMFRLMDGAFVRFKDKPEFHNLCKEFI